MTGERPPARASWPSCRSGPSHRIVNVVVRDEVRGPMAQAKLEHRVVSGAWQGNVLQRVDAELREEGGPEGLHDVCQAEVHAQVAIMRLLELLVQLMIRALNPQP